MITEQQLESFLDLNRLQQSETQFQRIPLEAESNLFNKVRQGDYKNIQLSAFSKMEDNLGRMAI